MKKPNFIIIIMFLIGIAWPAIGWAVSFPADYQSLNFEAKYLENTRVRTSPEVLSNNIMMTLPSGSLVQVLGQSGVWYYLELKTGQTGWSMKEFLAKNDGTVNVTNANTTNSSGTNNTSLLGRVTGRLLLQVQQQGQIWYVDVPSQKRYLVTKDQALPLFRALSLGITNQNLSQIFQCDGKVKPANELSNRLSGRLLLAVEDLGRVWYVYPDQNCRYEVRTDNIMDLFRALSLGITDSDLAQIPMTSLPGTPAVSVTPVTPAPATTPSVSAAPTTPVTSASSSVALTSSQPTNIADINQPPNLNLAEVEAYWLQEVNELRSAAGLRTLVSNKYLRATAQEWAVYMGRDLGYCTHDRPDGSSMHKWIDTKNIPWTVRYSANGWNSNYFTENIAYGYTNGTLASTQKMLDGTLGWMLDEASYNGSHYRTLYHADWNSVGMGFYFQKVSENNYKIYIAWHYGSVDLGR